MITRTVLALGACAVTGILLSSLRFAHSARRHLRPEQDEVLVPLFV